LDPEKKSRARINPKGSIAAELQEFFGAEAKIVDAFQNISPNNSRNLTKKSKLTF
jgi:predicted dinucleotide-binding enzyme